MMKVTVVVPVTVEVDVDDYRERDHAFSPADQAAMHELCEAIVANLNDRLMRRNATDFRVDVGYAEECSADYE